MQKFIILFLSLFLSTSIHAADFSEALKSELGSCVNLSENLQQCKPSACVKPHKQIEGAWHTTIIKGYKGDKCYTVSYAFLNDKVVSDVEHCYYNKEDLYSAGIYAQRWSGADSALEARSAENDWIELKYKVCKIVTLNEK